MDRSIEHCGSYRRLDETIKEYDGMCQFFVIRHEDMDRERLRATHDT